MPPASRAPQSKTTTPRSSQQGASNRPRLAAAPKASASKGTSTSTSTPTTGRAGRPTVGPGAGSGSGSGRLGQGFRRRHRKVLKDTIQGITKGDIRRLARRGGVKRISAGIYDEARFSMREFMRQVIGDAIACVELRRSQTMHYTDVTYALRRLGRTLYGFA